jgi:2-iminobutanoate/2-iminopropanoate deaminase
MKAISTSNAPAAIGPYSQAIEANGTIYVSGQLPINPATGEFAQGGIKAEARQSLTNIKNILAAEGLDMSNVVKVTVLLADISYFAEVNEVYAEFFAQPYPARSAFAVAALPKGANIEIEAIAVK